MMAEVIRRRVIPASLKAITTHYRVDTRGIEPHDTLVVEISHEKIPFHKMFKFRGSDLLQKKSLGFRVVDDGRTMDIAWSGVQPVSRT